MALVTRTDALHAAQGRRGRRRKSHLTPAREAGASGEAEPLRPSLWGAEGGERSDKTNINRAVAAGVGGWGGAEPCAFLAATV